MNEIYASFDEAKTLYALVWYKNDNTIWNSTDETWDTYTDADIDKYDIPLTVEVDSDYHVADFPVHDDILPGVYRVQIMWQVGGSIDADADRAVFQGEVYWDGTEEINLYTANTASATVEAKIDIIDSNVDEVLVAQQRVDTVLDETQPDKEVVTIRNL